MRSSLPWLILAAVLVSAVLAWLTLTLGGGASRAPAQNEHRDLAPFHEVEIGGSAHVTLMQADAEAIDVETRGRSVHVDADTKRGRLVVSARDGRRWWSGLFRGRAAEPPNITIHFRELDAIALSGAVKLAVPKLETARLHIHASGGSSLSVNELRATSLRVDGSGALEADIAGRVDEERVSISGAGNYRADRLYANDVTVSVSGVGSVVLRAERSLRASISGAGVIEYVGDPTVTEHVSGIGRVRRRDPAPGSGMRVDNGQWNESPGSPLKNNRRPVTASMSACTPGTYRMSASRQSPSSACSACATSPTASYG
jgi:hypothetical protein